MFEVEKVNVAPGEHGVLLPAFPLLDRADGQAQLGRPDTGLCTSFIGEKQEKRELKQYNRLRTNLGMSRTLISMFSHSSHLGSAGPTYDKQ